MQEASSKVVSGWVSPGFEGVLHAFELNFQEDKEIGASCAAFYKGQQVVDLWGGWALEKEKRQWQKDTLANVYSCTKGVINFCLMLLIDRGLLRYEDLITKHWPEFGQNGKGSITVSQLLTHRGGLAYFDDPFTLTQLEEWQAKSHDAFASFLAKQTPKWDINSGEHGYHPLTVGFFASELIRRVDPKGRKVRRFFAEEVAPLGIDFHFGLPAPREDSTPAQPGEPNIDRVARLYYSRTPPADTHMEFAAALSTDKTSHSYKGFNAVKGFTPWKARYLEVPSAVGYSTATGLAKIYSIVANNGKLRTSDGSFITVIHHPEVIRAAAEKVTEGKDLVLLKDKSFSRGGFQLEPQIPSALFHGGMGGSIGWGDRENNVSFSYIPNELVMNGADYDERSLRLRTALYSAIASLPNNKRAPHTAKL